MPTPIHGIRKHEGHRAWIRGSGRRCHPRWTLMFRGPRVLSRQCLIERMQKRESPISANILSIPRMLSRHRSYLWSIHSIGVRRQKKRLKGIGTNLIVSIVACLSSFLKALFQTTAINLHLLSTSLWMTFWILSKTLWTLGSSSCEYNRSFFYTYLSILLSPI